MISIKNIIIYLMIKSRKTVPIAFFFFLMALFSQLLLSNSQTITTTNPVWGACPLVKTGPI